MKLGTQHLNAFSKVSDLVWQRTQRASSPSSNSSSLELPSAWILKLSGTLGCDPGWRFSCLLINLWLYFMDLRLRRSCSQPTTLQVLSLPGHPWETPKTSFLSIRCAHSGHKGINIEDLERQMWEVTSRSWKKQDHKWSSIQLKRTVLRMILISGFQDYWLTLSHM